MGLLSEIRRRNVHRMMALYIAAAWLVMQVTDVLEDLLELAPVIGQYVVILLAVGFPIALIVSWFYELTSEGLMFEGGVAAEDSIQHVTGRRIDFVIIAVLSAAVLVFAWDKWGRADPPDSMFPVTSIAVLPLQSLSEDPEQDFFADQMTRILITELTKIDQLHVTSKHTGERIAAAEYPLSEIAGELGIEAFIEGSTRWVGDEVHLNLQLVLVSEDRNVWADQYRRDVAEIFTLQSEIVRVIAGQLQIELTPSSEARLARRRPVVPEALRFWLIGNEHVKDLHLESFGLALRNFERAIEIDPGFAPAHAGISLVHTFRGGWFGDTPAREAIGPAKDAALEAVRLDPESAEARFALASVYVLEWDWISAEQEFRRGAELNPSDSLGLIEYANFLCAMGRYDESVAVAMRAVAMDPLSPIVHNELGHSLAFGGRLEEGLATLEHALQLDPEFFQTQWALAEMRVRKGDYDGASVFLSQLRQDLESHAPSTIGLLGSNYAIIGRTEDAQYSLSLLLARAESEYVLGSAPARIYAALGQRENALDWLEIAYEQKDLTLIWLRIDPHFTSLHGDPRYETLVSRLEFPDHGSNED